MSRLALLCNLYLEDIDMSYYKKFYSFKKYYNLLYSIILFSIFLISSHSEASCVGDIINPHVKKKYDEISYAAMSQNLELYRYPTGKFYRVSEGGIVLGVLYGTMHSRMAAVTILPLSVYAEFLRADDVVVETDYINADPTDLRSAAQTVEGFNAPIGAASLSALNIATGGSFFVALERASISIDYLASLSPSAALAFLGRPTCVAQWEKLNPNPNVLDMLLASWAHSLGKPVYSIESLTMASTGPLFSVEMRESLTKVLPLALRRRAENNDLWNYFLAEYVAGRPGYAAAFDNAYLTEAPEIAAKLEIARLGLSQRNIHFVNFIVNRLKNAGYHFIAIGEGHLIGENGVVDRLIKAGYTIDDCKKVTCN